MSSSQSSNSRNNSPKFSQLLASPSKASSSSKSKPTISATSPGIPRDQSWSSIESGMTASSVTPSSIFDSPKQSTSRQNPSRSTPKWSVPEETEDEERGSPSSVSPPTMTNTYTVRNSKDSILHRSPESAKTSLERSFQSSASTSAGSSSQYRDDFSGFSSSTTSRRSGASSSATTSPILGSGESSSSSMRRKRMSSMAVSSHSGNKDAHTSTSSRPQDGSHKDDSTAGKHASRGRRVVHKGGGEAWEWFKRDNIHSQRYHPFSSEEVPYMLPYHREQVDRDILRDLMLRDRVQVLPWSDKAPMKHKELDYVPKRALDVGCGIAASWMVEAASHWPETQFVGLDIAPVLLPLDRLPPSISSRLSFIQSNFLDTPLSSLFPADEGGLFDFIRLSHVGFGVPESDWQSLLDELVTLLVPEKGWMQVLESSIPNLLDTESKQWKSGTDTKDGQRWTSGGNSMDVLATARTSQVERVGQAVATTFSKREVSLFPTSIFPAAFVLACKSVQTDGPLTLEAPATLPTKMIRSASGELLKAEELMDWYSTPEGQADIAMRVYEHAEMDAFAADAFYEGDSSADSDGHHPTMRQFVEYEKCASQFVSNVQHRAGLAHLISSRFGWTCEADDTIEESLTRQVEALTYERDLLDAEPLQTQAQDDGRMHEIARTLREAKADLEGTRLRLGKGEWNDPLGNRKFSVEVLMKAGRKA